MEYLGYFNPLMAKHEWKELIDLFSHDSNHSKPPDGLKIKRCTYHLPIIHPVCPAPACLNGMFRSPLGFVAGNVSAMAMGKWGFMKGHSIFREPRINAVVTPIAGFGNMTIPDEIQWHVISLYLMISVIYFVCWNILKSRVDDKNHS